MTDGNRNGDDRLGPPPVDAMSDVEWARVERGLFARLETGTAVRQRAGTHGDGGLLGRRALWLAIPALAAAAATLVFMNLRGDAPTRDAVADRDDVEPSRVVAGSAPSAVSFGDAHIELAATTAIVMQREHGAPSVLVERGTANFAVAPRAQRPPFIVRAGDTVVRVIGTRFEVARSDERVTVGVEHGIVEVQFRGRIQRVAAGQTWSSDRPETTGPLALVMQHSATGAATADASAVTTSSDTASANEIEMPTEPVSDVTAGETSRKDRKTPAAPPKPAADGDADRVKYEQLAAIEARQPDKALAGYLELSRGRTTWAAVALYAAGRLAADRHDRRAATLLFIYLRRFPNGANAEDARRLIERLEGESRP